MATMQSLPALTGLLARFEEQWFRPSSMPFIPTPGKRLQWKFAQTAKIEGGDNEVNLACHNCTLQADHVPSLKGMVTCLGLSRPSEAEPVVRGKQFILIPQLFCSGQGLAPFLPSCSAQRCEDPCTNSR